jgi:hypothetical protein
MRFLRLALTSAALASLATVAAHADTDWQKSYPVSGKASITFSTGDSATEVRACGDCHEVRIRVQWNDRHIADYTITESQTGSHVAFELREKPHVGFMQIRVHHAPLVTIESPAEVDLEGRTSDGSLRVSGLNGNLQLRTSDGSLNVDDVRGALRITASDGSIRVHNAAGSLESRSSDGSVQIDGNFNGVQVHTSDGSLELTLAEGSKLTTASRVESSDGRVTLRVPRTLAADLEVHTGDGHLQCDLPLVMEGFNSKTDSGHNLRGRLNGGGVPLTIHTSDGNVTISPL